MKKSGKSHSSSFKAKVALEALREEETTAEIANGYEVHQSQVRTWKRALLESASGIFGGDHGQEQKKGEALVAQLYQQIAQLKVEKDLLESRLGR